MPILRVSIAASLCTVAYTSVPLLPSSMAYCHLLFYVSVFCCGLRGLQKNSCFVSGHDFKSGRKRLRIHWALAPEALLPCPARVFRGLYRPFVVDRTALSPSP